VTPSLPGYQFDGTALPVIVGSVNTNGVDFTAWPVFTVSGRVTNGAGAIVTINSTDGFFTDTVSTDSQGNYTDLVPTNTYTITPTNTCFHFTPTNRVINVRSNTNVNFTAIVDAYTISGKVVTTNGTTAFSGVTVSAVGESGVGQSAKSGANGTYTLTNFCAGDYTVTASFPGCQFPPQSSVTVGPTNASGVNFAAVGCNSTISGLITEGANGLSGVAVQLYDTVNDINVALVGTAVNGSYVLAGICPGTYSVTPSLAGYQFAPASTNVVTDGVLNVTNVNFTATRFQIAAITLSANGTVQISVTNPGATTYWLEASTNLDDPSSWKGIFTNTSPFQFTDSITNSVRFYRAGVQ
jgi:hypothetical protein